MITKEQAVELYQTASAEWKEILKTTFGEDAFQQNKKSQIKEISFTNVFDMLAESLTADEVKILAYIGNEPTMLKLQAYLKLMLIAKVLNEGWVPDWINDDEYKFYPVFYCQSDMEFQCGSCQSCTRSTYGAYGVCFKTPELAFYAGKQFQDIYNIILKPL